MNRADFEHVVAAAANVVGLDTFVVIGSQAILGPYPDAPPGLLRSAEVDLYPAAAPERAIEVDGSLGEGSAFHEAFGYYAHGVGPETARAPAGWEQRLIPTEIPPRPRSPCRPVARCLEIHDLVLAKCVAARDRDWEFADDALAADLVDRGTLLSRIADLPADGPTRIAIRTRLSPG